MSSTVMQPSLTGGELSPSLYGRTDLARYTTCLKTCRNFITQVYGGIRNRPGTKFVAEVKDSAARTRLIPFSFSTEQSYQLEFGNEYMRVIKDGAQVILPNPLDVYAAGTTYAKGQRIGYPDANTPWISLKAGNVGNTPTTSPLWWQISLWADTTTYVVGDYVYYSGEWYYSLQDTNLNHYPDVSPTWWALLEDGVVEIPTPYATADLPMLKYTQSADVMVIAHASYAPMRLSRLSHDSWTLEEFPFENGPFQGVNTDLTSTVRASGALGDITITATQAIFLEEQIGQLFFIEQKGFGQPWEVAKAVTAGNIRRRNGNYYVAETSGTTGTLGPANLSDTWNDGAVEWAYLHPGFGCASITAVAGDGLSCSATVVKRIPDSAVYGGADIVRNITAVGTNPSGTVRCTIVGHGYATSNTVIASVTYTDVNLATIILSGTYTVYVVDGNTFDLNVPFPADFALFVSGTAQRVSAPDFEETHKWAFGAWGGDQGWPSVVTFHQQRLCFANTPAQPQTVWMSRSGAYADFGTSTPILDDDSITFTLAAAQVNAVKGLLSLDTLLLLTSGGEWVVGSGIDDVLTPANIAPKPRGFFGSADLAPLGVGDTALYVQGKARTVRDLTADPYSNRFAGFDLSVMASHLVDGKQIEEWAYHQVPYSCVWMVRSDGVLLGMTYMREQQVVGWHQHDTLGVIESVSVISEGDEHAAYLIVKRTINGVTKRYIEQMQTRFIEDMREAFFVDCGLSYDGRNTTATTVAVTGGTAWDETEELTLTASSAIFTYPAQTDAGDEIVFETTNEDGAPVYIRLAILSTSSTTVATAVPNREVPAAFQSAPTAEWYFARDTFTGLDHLEGETVSVLSDGAVEAQSVVTSGAITLERPGFLVHVGLPYDCDFETLPLLMPSQETTREKMKLIGTVRLLVDETRGIFMGPDADHLEEALVREIEFYDELITPAQGIIEVNIPASWNRNGQVFGRQSDPLPVTVLAILPEVSLGGA